LLVLFAGNLLELSDHAASDGHLDGVSHVL
jgi:hypothetical protein